MKWRFLILLIMIAFGKFSLAQLPNIVAVEYFFNVDPGFGNGTQVTIPPDSLIEVTFDADFGSLPDGFHTLMVRTQDELGQWGIAFTNEVFKFSLPAATILSPLPDIVAMEYFFDTDPGFGSGTQILISTGVVTDVTFNADFSSLPDGFHTLMIRTQDETGIWSIAFTEEVFKFTLPVATNIYPLPSIIAMEYFFDVDPGFGSGIQVSISSGLLTDIAFNADFGSLQDGFHNLMVRTLDETGKWSLAYSSEVFKFTAPESTSLTTLPNIISMEYFFDNDPGFGNGVLLAVSNNPLVDLVFTPEYNTLNTAGEHQFFVRVKDEFDKWSLLFVDTFTVSILANFEVSETLLQTGDTVFFTDLSVSSDIVLTWFWDFGDGTTSTIQHPSHIYNVSGDYTISLIVNDIINSDTLIMDNYITVNPTPLLIIDTTIDNICYGSSMGSIDLTITSGTPPYSFLWSNGEVTEDLENIETGTFFVTVTDTYFTSIHSYIINAPAELESNQQIANISISGANDGEVQLYVTGGTNPYSYIWNSGQTTTTISNLSPGFYSVSIQDINLCEKVDSFLIMTHDDQSLNMIQNWEIYSTYIIPPNSSMSDVVNPIVSNLVIVKDDNGNVYWPIFSVNMIGDILLGKGYQIKMNNVDTLLITGLYKEPELHSMVIPSGWSILGYLRKIPADIVVLFSSIESEIVIVKNGAGLVYWPVFNVNMIGDMNPGKGYQIKLDLVQNFVFPAN